MLLVHPPPALMAAVESSRAAAGPLKGLDNESERQQPDTVTALPAFREEDGEKPTAWQQKMIELKLVYKLAPLRPASSSRTWHLEATLAC